MALVFHGKKFFSIPEAAERPGVTRLTVYRWISGTRGAPADVAFDRVMHDTRSRQAYVPEAVVDALRQALRHEPPGARKRKGRPAS